MGGEVVTALLTAISKLTYKINDLIVHLRRADKAMEDKVATGILTAISKLTNIPGAVSFPPLRSTSALSTLKYQAPAAKRTPALRSCVFGYLLLQVFLVYLLSAGLIRGFTSLEERGRLLDCCECALLPMLQFPIFKKKNRRQLYDNMKNTARSNLYSDKKNSYKTGGGTFVPKSTALDAKIVTMLKDQFRPLHNKFDSSASYIDGQPKPRCSGLINIREKYNIYAFRLSLRVQYQMVLNIKSPNTPGRIDLTRASPSASVSSETPSPPPEQQVEARVGQKQKLQSIHVPKRRRTCGETLSNRFVGRKNFKDLQDAEIKDTNLEH
ncbi:hypothetical protein Zmor_024123 [Zophobas morio]|uniref:Uncharacterized protein n=1 Tax=Zophobas morio TaxID=2755281 RepID=A0AA38M824_9CUCU|nr:hypothetical protein Zmor_024123 [Zophobas morio]